LEALASLTRAIAFIFSPPDLLHNLNLKRFGVLESSFRRLLTLSLSSKSQATNERELCKLLAISSAMLMLCAEAYLAHRLKSLGSISTHN
jgi:Na+/pantothenate symporter